VIDAEDGEKLALVLDDHAGAKLCRFDAAHCFAAPTGSGRLLPEKFLISEIPEGQLTFAHTLLAE